jgi:predicted RNA methylase
VEETFAERAARIAAEARTERLRAQPGRGRELGIVPTPTPIARVIARLALDAARRLAPSGPWLCIDPACGTGTFGAAWLAAIEEAGIDTGAGALVCLDVDADAVEATRAALEETARARGVVLDAHRVHDALATVEFGLPDIGANAPAVVLGNPPWASRTTHRGGPVGDALLADFRREADGSLLRGSKPGVLSDAYVRFLRWGLALVERAPGGGVLAMVTNASYLDGPAHRGMRAYLRLALDAITVLDLGGSALVGRASGPRDENVFGVRPGVAVLIGERGRRAMDATREPTPVRVMRLRGSAREKVATLLERTAAGDAATGACLVSAPLHASWRPATSPVDGGDAYDRWPSLADLFAFHAEGLQTNRDAALIDTDRDRLLDRLVRFSSDRVDLDLAPLLKPLPHYDPDEARRALRAALAAFPHGGPFIRRILYRPFDERFACTLSALAHRPRAKAARAVDHSRLCLVSTSHDRGERPFAHVLVTRHLPDNCALSTRSSCRARIFPSHQPNGMPNVDASRLGPTGGPPLSSEDAIAYTAAVLLAPAYRARFDPRLRAGFPRVMPAPDPVHRARIVEAGRGLVAAFVEHSDTPPLAPSDHGDPPSSPGDTANPRVGAENLVLGHHRVLEVITAQRGAAAASAVAPRIARLASHIAHLDDVVVPALVAQGVG